MPRSKSRRGRSGALGAIMSVGFLSSPALAQDAGQASAPEQHALPEWTLGTGVSIAAVSWGTLVGMYPAVGVTLERRLTRRIWLLGRVAGGYSTSRSDSDSNPVDSTAMDVEGAIGARFVVTPDEPFQFSAYLLGGADYARSDSDDRSVLPAEEWSVVSAHAGIALDRELTRGVGVRLSTTLAYGGWYHANRDFGDFADSFDGLVARVALDPAIELRFSW